MERKRLHWDPFVDSYLTDVASRVAPVFIPSFDIRDAPEGYLFWADLPGVRLEDVEIQLLGNRLTITGERLGLPLAEGETIYAAERTLGTFSRTFNLPDDIDPSRVEATLTRGVLAIQVPKRGASPDPGKTRRVPISDGPEPH